MIDPTVIMRIQELSLELADRAIETEDILTTDSIITELYDLMKEEKFRVICSNRVLN